MSLNFIHVLNKIGQRVYYVIKIIILVQSWRNHMGRLADLN